MNKLIDLSLDNAIDRDTFLERKENFWRAKEKKESKMASECVKFVFKSLKF